MKRKSRLAKADLQVLISIPVILAAAVGIAAAGSQTGFTIFGLPIFALCVFLAFFIQWIAFIPAFLNSTEAFYDLIGSITYLTLVVLALIWSPVIDIRSCLLSGLVSIWAVRLGSFLFFRTRAVGEDRRFRGIKTSFTRFLLTWTLQGLWVNFTLAAALSAITSLTKSEMGLIELIGFLLWLLGFSLEVIADLQKTRFNASPENSNQFIRTGLWSWSRHPNYFGEIILWIGIAIIALPVLRGWQLLTLISPLFVVLLLTRISGIPMLEVRADEKWGSQADYQEYKAKTAILIPLPPSKR